MIQNTNIYYLIPYLLYGSLALLLITSSITDIRYRKIPNMFTFSSVFLTFFIYICVGGAEGLIFSFKGLVAGFIIFFVPYLMGGMGAGDVKLMSAVGAVIGISHTVASILFIAILGGLMAFVQTLRQGSFKQTLSRLKGLIPFLGKKQSYSLLKIEKDEVIQDGIPYGVAISGGVFLYFIYLVLNKQPLPFFVVS